MNTPDFRTILGEKGTGVTYTCGCPCQPTAYPSPEAAGFEHCCCGKVHFAGPGAGDALNTYLAERATRRKREPEYERGAATVAVDGAPVEVAWAFPREG